MLLPSMPIIFKFVFRPIYCRNHDLQLKCDRMLIICYLLLALIMHRCGVASLFPGNRRSACNRIGLCKPTIRSILNPYAGNRGNLSSWYPHGSFFNKISPSYQRNVTVFCSVVSVCYGVTWASEASDVIITSTSGLSL